MHSNNVAWVQGALFVAVVTAISLTIALRVHRPFDRNTLAIQVARLHSSAAQAQLLVDNTRADRLARGFVRQHAQQMADRVGTTNGKLRKPAQAGLAAQEAQARQLGAAPQQALSAWGRDGKPPRTSAFCGWAEALDGLKTRLGPAAIEAAG